MASRKIKGITIEIGGETTELSKALSGVEKESNSLQKELTEVNKLLKLDPSNTELLSQKQKILKDAINATSQKLDTLKEAERQVQQQFQNGEISEEQYRALQREIINTEQELKELEKVAGESAIAVQKIAVSGEKLQNFGGNVSDVGKKFMPVTAGVTALGTASVTTAANFEASMSQVQATMGITKDAMSTVNGQSVNTMDTLEELAKKMGSETAFSASQCAEALNYLALAGYDTEEMCNTLPTVLNLAAAGDIELASASDMVTDAMSALGMGVEEAGIMVDQMAKTASTTNTSVAQLGEGILTIGATAKSIKGGTAELNTALGILANNGIKGAEGGTHLRNMILSLQNPVEAGEKAMESLGLKVYDAAGNMRSLNDIFSDLNKSMEGMTSEEKSSIINKIFNKTDIASANAILANTGEIWDNLQNSIANSGGAAQQMADTQLDNLQGQITILKSALEGLAISFGKLLMPAIRQIVAWVQSLADKLNSMDEKTRKVIVTVALAAAAIAPLLIVVGKVISAVGTIMKIVPKLSKALTAVKTAVSSLRAVIAAHPIMAVITAIAALIAALVHLYNNCEWFRDEVNKIFGAIKDFVLSSVEVVKDFFINMGDEIKETVFDIAKTMEDVFKAVCVKVKAIFSTLGEFFAALWGEIKYTFTKLGTSIADAISGAVKTGINGIIGFIEDTINGAIRLINGAIKLINKIPGVEIGTIKELDLPKLAKGGALYSGSAIVAEAGPELVQVMDGKTIVTPLTNAAKNTNINNLKGDTKNEISLNIENFYNNRQQDIKELTMEVLQTAEEIRERERRAYA